MENASKALLIAGAVLIVILIIAFAVKVASSANEPTEQTEGAMDMLDVATFNGKFIGYKGKQTGSKLKTLGNLVATNNANNSIYVKFGGYANKVYILNYLKNIEDSKIYNVTIEDSNGDGYYDAITFSPIS